MELPVINLKNKLSLFSEHWSPRVIGELNDYQVKLAKLKSAGGPVDMMSGN